MRWMTCLLLLHLIFTGCGSESGPTVERVDGVRSSPVRVETWTINGQRDGARTRAVTTWKLEDGESLHVELVFAYDPNPVLAEGHWLSDTGGGTVESKGVRFVGGQGDGPSVGGRFVLLDDGEAKYVLDLPLTRVQTAAPTP